MPPYCSECGTELSDDAAYCRTCGAEIPASTSTRDEAATTPVEDNEPESGQTTTASESDSSRIGGLTRTQQYLAVSCLVTVAGGFLPWLTATVVGTSISVQGIERDGVFTLGAGVLVLLFLFAKWTKRTRQSSVVLGALVALLAAIYISDPWAFSDTTTTQLQRQAVNIGIGLYVTLFGGVGMAAFAYRAET